METYNFPIRYYEIPTWTPDIFGPNPMSRQKVRAAKERKRLAKLRRKQGR